MKRYSPHPYLMVIAPPASGKGVATLAARLLSRIELRTSKSGGAARPRTVLIPANSSASAFVRQLSANGGAGVVIETEMDTISATRRQEWGDYSHVLRQAAEHEAVSLNRNDGLVHVSNPRLGVFLAGTPDQATRLFPTAEDGLFSRFGLYAYDPEPVWHSRQPGTHDTARMEAMDSAAAHLGEIHNALEARDVDLDAVLDDAQWSRLDASFADLHCSVVSDGLPPTYEATVKRAATLAFRVAIILGVIRRSSEEVGIAERLLLTDDDVDAGIWLAFALAQHGLGFLERHASASCERPGLRCEELLSALPDEYTSIDLLQAGASIDIQKRQSYSYNAELLKQGAVEKVARGKYRKVLKP